MYCTSLFICKMEAVPNFSTIFIISKHFWKIVFHKFNPIPELPPDLENLEKALNFEMDLENLEN